MQMNAKFSAFSAYEQWKSLNVVGKAKEFR